MVVFQICVIETKIDKIVEKLVNKIRNANTHILVHEVERKMEKWRPYFLNRNGIQPFYYFFFFFGEGEQVFKLFLLCKI